MKKIGTKTELAALLGLSQGRISQLIPRGLPVRSDRKMDFGACTQWYRDNVREDLRGGTCAGASGDAARRVAVDVLRRVSAPLEAMQFGRVALRVGCTPVQAFALAMWFSIQPCLTIREIDSEDLMDFQAPTEAQWCNLLGKDFDFSAGDQLENDATWPEIDPAHKAALLT